MTPGLIMDCIERHSKELDEKAATASTGSVGCRSEGKAMGSRRIFAPQFKLQVLDSYRHDADCRGNQRATARKYGIHRRQIQKWLQVEASLRTTVEVVPSPELTALNLCGDTPRQRDDSGESRKAVCQQNVSVTRNEKCNTQVSLYPSVKIEVAEQPQVKKRVRISLFPSVKVEVTEDQPEETFKIEEASEDEMDDISVQNTDIDQPLDFSCTNLSKRRSFSLQFKLEVLDAFHTDRSCHGNQRATARKFGINRRQVQKWLGQEVELRGEAGFRGGLYRQRLGRWVDMDETKQVAEDHQLPDNSQAVCDGDQCWDLSIKKRKLEHESKPSSDKRMTTELSMVDSKCNLTTENSYVTSSACDEFSVTYNLHDIQETALCLVKVDRRCKESVDVVERLRVEHPEVTSTVKGSICDQNARPVQYCSNNDSLLTSVLLAPQSTTTCYAPPPGFGGLHRMLSLYHDLVVETKSRQPLYPLDLKPDGLDYYPSSVNYQRQGNQEDVACKFGLGLHHHHIQKWQKQEEELRQQCCHGRLLNMFR